MAELTTEQKIAQAIAALGGGIAGRSLASSPQSNVPPQYGQLLDMSLQQQAYQNPLRQAVTQGTYAMLPTFAKEGTQLTGGLPNAIPAPSRAGGSGGGGVNKAGVATGASMAALAGLMGSPGGAQGNLSSIFNAIKKLFHRSPNGTVQGDRPNAGGAMSGGGQEYDDFGSFQGWDGQTPDGMLISDPFQWYDGNGMGPTVTDPSGGTGIGPGMQDYYNNQNWGGGDAGEPNREQNWWEE